VEELYVFLLPLALELRTIQNITGCFMKECMPEGLEPVHTNIGTVHLCLGGFLGDVVDDITLTPCESLAFRRPVRPAPDLIFFLRDMGHDCLAMVRPYPAL
jgi:hypothetical protein